MTRSVAVLIRTHIGTRAWLAILLCCLTASAAAHHGWRWATDEEFELSGTVKEARLGNPHGELKVDADGDLWTVEVGQPWRHERVDLKDDMLKPGTELTIHGHRSAEAGELLMKAERLVIDGKDYNLYPDRKS
ncbi:DUF6152 family protein [Allohahella marinimesophila]|uniref:DUF6152 family protein n=1 Tax=Allohahella marinimesophila TaxID=1054972 RepID=A0ABP7NYD0_9GAMM